METPKSLFVGLPCYDGKVHLDFMISLMNVMGSFSFPFQISGMPGDGVARTRNNLVSMFLKTDHEWLLFLDTDLIFSPYHIERLISHGLPIVGGLYPKKQMKLEWVINTLDSTAPDENGLLEIKYAGTGCILINRSVFTDMIKAFPEIEYKNDTNQDDDIRHDFFSMGVFQRRYLSEDWYFCERWRQLGGKIMVDTKVQLRRIGSIVYPLPEQKQEESKKQEA